MVYNVENVPNQRLFSIDTLFLLKEYVLCTWLNVDTYRQSPKWMGINSMLPDAHSSYWKYMFWILMKTFTFLDDSLPKPKLDLSTSILEVGDCLYTWFYNVHVSIVLNNNLTFNLKSGVCHQAGVY